jgi:hypothetical protein
MALSRPRPGFNSRMGKSIHFTGLAQSVERWPFKPVVEGSSPSFGDFIFYNIKNKILILIIYILFYSISHKLKRRFVRIYFPVLFFVFGFILFNNFSEHTTPSNKEEIL